ncbi:uncharacterized protein LOC115215197 [Argonauta hians]
MARLFILFAVFIIYVCQLVTGLKVSACFKENKDFLEASCPAGYMVRILRSFYGQNSRGSCSYEENDCIQEDEQNYPCMGRQFCRVNLPTKETGQRTKKCDFNYFQVEYQCVKKSETVKICDTKLLTGPSGYISSARYPNNVQGPFVCDLSIRVQPHQKIQLYILDLDLKGERNKNCTDFLLMNIGTSTITICNRSVNEKSIPTSKNVLNLTLTMNSRGKSKGLWLYYEAFPSLPSTPTPIVPTKKYTTERAVSPRLIVSDRNSKQTDKPTVRNYQHYQSDPKPAINNSVIYVAATAGVVGTLLFILIAFLIFLVFKIHIKKKRQKIYSKLMIQNQNLKNMSHNTTNISNISNIEI